MPSLMATLGANISPFVNSLNRAKAEASIHGEDIGSKFVGALKGKFAGLASVAALEQIVQQAVEFGSEVHDLSGRLGISAEAVQQWQFALKQSGGSGTEFVGFFEKLAIARDKAFKGNEQTIASFAKLGVSMEALRSMRIEDIGAMIADGFKDGDPQLLMSSIRDVGGKSAGEMIAMFRDGFRDLADEASKFAISDETADQLDKIGDAWGSLTANTKAFFAETVSVISMMGEEFSKAISVAVSFTVGVVDSLIETATSPKKWLTPFTSILDGIKAGVGTAQVELAKQDATISENAHKRVQRMIAKDKPILTEEESEKAGKDKEKAIDAAAKLHMAQMDRLAKLEEENRKKEDAASLRKLTAAQQVLALEKQRADLVDQQAGHVEGTIAFEETKGKLLDKDKDIAEAKKRAAQDEKAVERAESTELPKLQAVRNEVNSLQRIGGFLGGYSADPNIQLLDVSKKSERHLEQIRRTLERKKASAADSSDTEF